MSPDKPSEGSADVQDADDGTVLPSQAASSSSLRGTAEAVPLESPREHLPPGSIPEDENQKQDPPVPETPPTDVRSGDSAVPAPPVRSEVTPDPPPRPPDNLPAPDDGNLPAPPLGMQIVQATAPMDGNEEPQAVVPWRERTQQVVQRAQQAVPKLPQSRLCWLCSLSCDDFWQFLESIPWTYCSKLARMHWACFFVFSYAVVIILAISAAWRRVEINADLEVFQRVDDTAAMHHDVYLAVLKHARSAVNANASGINDRTVFRLEIFYEAKEGSILHEGALRDIRSFEQKLRDMPGWRRLCSQSAAEAQFQCEPGDSIGNYVWPRRLDLFLGEQGFFRLRFDGTARERLPVPVTLAFLGNQGESTHDSMRFLPQDFGTGNGKPVLLRSTFAFSAPDLQDGAFSQDYVNFVKDELYPELLNASERSRKEPDPTSWDEPMRVSLFFTGDVLDEYEVRTMLEHDLKSGAWAIVFTLLISWFQFRSLFLASVGLFLLCMTEMLAYVAVPIPKLSLASFLGIFLVFGLGVHGLFRVHATWRRSRSSVEILGWQLEDRIMEAHMAASLNLMPMVASALSFYFCLYATLRPMREFGLFMGAGMLFSCLLSILVFMPVLIVHEMAVEPFIRERLPRIVACVLEPPRARHPTLNWKSLARNFARVCIEGCGCANKCFGRRRFLLLVGAVWLLLLICVVSVAVTRDSTGLPEIFPPSHNRNVGRSLALHFVPPRLADADPPILNATFCEPGRGLGGCGMYWCEAPLAAPAPAPLAEPQNASETSTCICRRTLVPENCGALKVTTFFSGQAAADLLDYELVDFTVAHVRSLWPQSAPQLVQNRSSIRKPSLVLEEWESGATEVEPLVQIPDLGFKMSGGQNQCSQQFVCHCGSRVCKKPAGFLNEDVREIKKRRRLSASGLSGMPSSMGVAAGIQVTVVFGITPPESSRFLDGVPEWSFDSTFDPVSPWAQRAMYAICAHVPPELAVVDKRCWISDFRRWLIAQGMTFPIARFDGFYNQVDRFVAEHKSVSSDMWLDTNRAIRATTLHMHVAKRSSATQILEEQRRWRSYVAEKNLQASTGASQAWPTSQTWVEMEAYDEALSSAWRVALLNMLGAAACGLLFMKDLEIVGMMVIINVALFTGLLFLMLCIFQWQFGPWEMLIASVFLSNALEPAFRIGRDFVMPPSSEIEYEASGDKDGQPNPAEANGTAQTGPTHLMALQDGAVGSSDPAAGANSTVDCTGASSMACCDNEDEGPIVPEDCISDGSSAAVQIPPATPEAALERSVYLSTETVIASSVQLTVCGLIIIPCDFRLFTRLGATAVVFPLFWIFGTMVLVPAAILASGRLRREPDLWLIWRCIQMKCGSMFA